MKVTIAICAAGVMAIALASMLVCVYFVIRASLNRRRPSYRWFVHTNPVNAALFKDELTPKGLEYRAKASRAGLVALIAFVVLTAASMFLAPFN